MKNEIQKELSGMHSEMSSQNTKDQVSAHTQTLDYLQKASTARFASLIDITNLSKYKQISYILLQIIHKAKTKEKKTEIPNQKEKQKTTIVAK